MRVPAISHPRDPRSRPLPLLLWFVACLPTGAIAEEFGGRLWLMDVLPLGVLATTPPAVSRTPRGFPAAILLGGAGRRAAT